MRPHQKILVLGSGPSTRALADYGLDRLCSDVDTFGMGAEYRFFREVGWWPRFYALGDSKVVFSHREELRATVEDPAVSTERFFFSWPVSEHPRFELIEHTSTGDFCFRKSLDLGYREIYLIGIEGHYVEELTESRPLSPAEFERLGYGRLHLRRSLRSTLRIITRTPEDNPNYFFSGYQREGDVYSLPQSGRHRDRWSDVAALAESSGARVLNLSATSRIEHFPKSTLAHTYDRLFPESAAARPEASGPACWFGGFAREREKRVDEARLVLDLFDAGECPVAASEPVMVDVGACRGGAFRGFAERGWAIHAFEPNPALYDELVADFTSDRISINKAAVSDTEGEEIPFYTSEESLGISSLQPFRPTHELAAHVATTTLDRYLSDHDVGRVDFLKIDTEGFDLMVLRGLDLDRRPPEVVLCEFEDSKSRPLGYTTRDMADYLASFGYTVYVSEWHPVTRYGGPHQWRILKSYPCDLEDEGAWGNLLAFRSDPGIWALTKALSEQVLPRPTTRMWRLTAPLRVAKDVAMRAFQRRRV